jgi:hypothetical protein
MLDVKARMLSGGIKRRPPRTFYASREMPRLKKEFLKSAK